MKKSKFLIFGLCSILLLTGSMVSCANAADGSSSSGSPATTTTPAGTPAATPATPAATGGGEVSGQDDINRAAAGSTVTLSSSLAGQSISINKALTVNGNNVANVRVTVDPSVRNNVTLRNLQNATIRVAATNSTNSSINTTSNNFFSSVRSIAGGIFRSDSNNPSGGTTTSTDKFAKVTDGAVPLHLEGCTGANIEAEGKVALYLEKGTGKKSEITEIKLKAGATDFSFIEFDDNGKEVADKAATPHDDKSSVGKLSIEHDDVSKINLIGGTFNNVAFENNVTLATIDSLKYDAEFTDQFSDNVKTNFVRNLMDDKKEDIGVAERPDSQQKVYKFTISRENIKAMNGYLTVVLMKDSQKALLTNQNGNPTWLEDGVSKSIATTAEPVYMMIPAGQFMVNDIDTATGLKTIYGAEYAYVDYARAIARGCEVGYESEDIVVLEKYRNYNKEAIIVDCGSSADSEVTIYVNMAAIKKSDVVLCCGEHDSNGRPIKTEAGTKLSVINLDGYKPYIALDYSSHTLLGVEPPNNQESFITRLPDNVAENYKEVSTPENVADLPENIRDQINTYYTNNGNGQQVPVRVDELLTGEGSPRSFVDNYYNPLNEQHRQARESILGNNGFPMHSAMSIHGTAIKLLYELDLRLFPMEPENSYKDVSSVTYTEKATPTDKTNHPLIEQFRQQ